MQFTFLFQMNSNVAAVFAHWENRPNPYSHVHSEQTVEAESKYEAVVRRGRENWRSRFNNKLGPPPSQRWKRRQRMRYQERDFAANSVSSCNVFHLLEFSSPFLLVGTHYFVILYLIGKEFRIVYCLL